MSEDLVKEEPNQSLESINAESASEIFSSIFDKQDGYEIANKNRSDLQLLDSSNYTYGEIAFDPFIKLLSEVPIKQNASFLDLGSGSGKAMIAAALSKRFSKIMGVEQLEALIQLSKSNISELEREVSDLSSILIFDVQQGLIEGADLSQADVIFTHSTCFDDALMLELQNKVDSMKQTALLITCTKVIEHEQLRCIHKDTYMMNWGKATVFVYEKI